MWNAKYRDELEQKRTAAKAGGGEKRVSAQRAKG